MQRSLEEERALKARLVDCCGWAALLACLSCLGWIISLKFPAFLLGATGLSGLCLLGFIATPTKSLAYQGGEVSDFIREVSRVQDLRASDRTLLVVLCLVVILAILVGNLLVWQAAR